LNEPTVPHSVVFPDLRARVLRARRQREPAERIASRARLRPHQLHPLLGQSAARQPDRRLCTAARAPTACRADGARGRASRPPAPSPGDDRRRAVRASSSFQEVQPIGMELASTSPAYVSFQHRRLRTRFTRTSVLRLWFRLEGRVQPPCPRLQAGALLKLVLVSIVDSGCARAAIDVVQDLADVVARDSGFRHIRGCCPSNVVASELKAEPG
jgi:hypothetical protein